MQAGLLRRAPTPLAGQQLITPDARAQHDRLHDTRLANALREFLQGVRVEVPTRLLAAGADPVDGDIPDFGRRAFETHGAILRIDLEQPKSAERSGGKSGF